MLNYVLTTFVCTFIKEFQLFIKAVDASCLREPTDSVIKVSTQDVLFEIFWS